MSFRDTQRSMVVGVLAAVGASVCCVGPLLFITLGIGGAWIGNFGVFEPYRPILGGIALLCIGLAFRRLYLVKQDCVNDAACAGPAALKRQRILFWGVAILVLGLLASPLAAPLLM